MRLSSLIFIVSWLLSIIICVSATCNQCGSNSGVVCTSYNTFMFCSNGKVRLKNLFGNSKEIANYYHSRNSHVKAFHSAWIILAHRSRHAVIHQRFVQVHRLLMIVLQHVAHAAWMADSLVSIQQRMPCVSEVRLRAL